MKYLFLSLSLFSLFFCHNSFADTALKVSVSGNSSCAIYDTGVKCWGQPYPGTPEFINPKKIVTTVSHACVLDDVGVKCWGGNQMGESDVPKLQGPKEISVGVQFSCALDQTGVKCWGANDKGQTTVPVLKNPRAISSGYFRTCALDDTGVKCWGDKCADASCVAFPGVVKPTAIFVGGIHSCVIDENKVKCWGSNEVNQVVVPTLSNPKEISADLGRTCAIDDSGVVCWGNWGEIVKYPIPNFSTPKSLSISSDHGCVIDGGKVKCWGSNEKDAIITPEERAAKEIERLAKEKEKYIRGKSVQMIPSGSSVTFTKDILIGLNRSTVDIGVESKNVNQCVLSVMPDPRRERRIKAGKNYIILSVESTQYETEFETTFILDRTIATVTCFANSAIAITIGEVMDSLLGFGIKLNVLDIAEPVDL